MKTINPKGKPVPVRFAPSETNFLDIASTTTGLTHAELVRRAVRMVQREKIRAGGFGFLIDLAA